MPPGSQKVKQFLCTKILYELILEQRSSNNPTLFSMVPVPLMACSALVFSRMALFSLAILVAHLRASLLRCSPALCSLLTLSTCKQSQSCLNKFNHKNITFFKI